MDGFLLAWNWRTLLKLSFPPTYYIYIFILKATLLFQEESGAHLDIGPGAEDDRLNDLPSSSPPVPFQSTVGSKKKRYRVPKQEKDPQVCETHSETLSVKWTCTPKLNEWTKTVVVKCLRLCAEKCDSFSFTLTLTVHCIFYSVHMEQIALQRSPVWQTTDLSVCFPTMVLLLTSSSLLSTDWSRHLHVGRDAVQWLSQPNRFVSLTRGMAGC